MRGRPLTAERLDALGAALERLHGCVPAGVLGRMGRAGNDDAATAGASCDGSSPRFRSLAKMRLFLPPSTMQEPGWRVLKQPV